MGVGIYGSMRAIAPSSARALFGWLVVAFSLLLTPYLSTLILSENFRALAILLAFLLGGFSALFILGNWRMGVVMFFAWVVIEDLMRKFLGNSLLIYTIKDLIVVTSYVSFLMAVRRGEVPSWRNPLRIPLLAFAAWVAIEAFNPYIENAIVPIIGVRMTLFYVPMLYLGYAFFQSDQQFRRFFLLVMALAACVSALGMLQAFVGLDFLNPESAPHLRLDLVRQVPGTNIFVPRPTSTFVDAGRFSMYLFSMAFVGLGLLGYLHTARAVVRARDRFWAFAFWATVLAGLFLSAGRGAIFFLLLSFVILYLIQLVLRPLPGSQRRAFSLSKVLVAALLSVAVLGALSPERFSAVSRFFWETVDPTSPYTEAVSRPSAHWRDILYAFQAAGWIGHGTGSASLGLQYLKPLLTEQQVHYYRYQIEGGFAGVLWEWGTIGLVLWLWWSLHLVAALFHRAKALRSTPFFWPAVTTACCIAVLLFPIFVMGVSTYQNYLTQSLLWFTVGVVFRLSHLAGQTTPGADLRQALARTAGRARGRAWSGPMRPAWSEKRAAES